MLAPNIPLIAASKKTISLSVSKFVFTSKKFKLFILKSFYSQSAKSGSEKKMS